MKLYKDYKIRDQKLQLDVDREAAKILALKSGKIDKIEYLTGEYILPADQSRVIEQAKFTTFPLAEAKIDKINRRSREDTGQSFKSFKICLTATKANII